MRYLTTQELDALGERFQFLRRIRPPFGVVILFEDYVERSDQQEALLVGRLRDWALNPRIALPTTDPVHLN